MNSDLTHTSLMRQTELLNLYLKNMWIVKRRIRAVLSIYCDTEDKHTSTLFPHTNIEFSLLQIRKILELIALSSLISNFDLYKSQLENVERMWNARLIFREIERINPDFYPKAIIIYPEDRNHWHDRKEDVFERSYLIGTNCCQLFGLGRVVICLYPLCFNSYRLFQLSMPCVTG